MRRSEFLRAVEDEFEARAASLLSDLSLSSCDGLTAREALASGIDPRVIWLSLCEELDVPLARRHGVGRIEPRKR